MSTLISIIIPTRNEQKNLGRCLNSIVQNGFPSYEIIVVDQFSTDDTMKIVKKYHAKVVSTSPTEKYIPPSQSRNLGFEKSIGKYIYHLDADMELEPGLLQEIATLFADQSISALIVPEIDKPTNFWAKGKALERSFYFNTPMEAARVSRREIFAKTGYDKVITSGEDWNIHKLFSGLGKISRTQKTVYHHIGDISLSKEFRKKKHYGHGSGSFVSSNKKELLQLFMTLLLLYIRGFLKNLFIHPLTLISLIIVRAADLIGLLIGLFNTKNA